MSLTPGDLVRQITGTVKIAGRDRTSQVTSASIDREIATTLPTTAAAGGGLSKATGSVELTDPGVVVAQTRPSPWARSDGWPPERADTATVDVAVNDETPTRRFTGRVSAVDGSATDTTQVKLEDYTDRLKVDFSHPAMQQTMPPPGDSSGAMLNIGLRADWLAEKIMRKAGFNVTPPVMGVGILSVPAQGSMWPQTGTCQACSQVDGTGQPVWYRAPWGWTVANVAATYGKRDVGNQTMRGRLLVMNMLVSEDHASTARMDVTLGEANVLSVIVTGTRQITLRYDGAAIGTVTPPAGWTRLDVSWGESLGGARVRTDNGFSRVVTTTFRDAYLDSAYSKTDITVQPAARAAGFIVQLTPNSYSGGYVGVESTATIVAGTLLTQMRAMPSITSRDGLDLLTEISQATVTSMWIDHNGHLWWVHPDALRDQDPALGLTSTKDLLDLAWQDTSDSARRSVTITYDDPTTRGGAQHRLKAWEGSGDNLQQGESYEEIINPSASQDWIEVDGLGAGDAIYCTPYPANPQSLPDFNRGIGTWAGGTHLDANGDSPQTKLADWDPTEGDRPPWITNHNDDFPNLVRSLTQIGPAAWKLSVGLEDIASNYWPEIQQKLDPVKDHEGAVAGVGSDINMSWTGQNMPIVRCKRVTDWETQEYTSTITGPDGYDDLNHEAGPWVGSGAPALADWIAQQVTKPTAILDGFPINYRSDIHLGMVINIVEDAIYDVRVRALVIGMKESHKLAESTLTLTCRVISVERLSWTYDEQTRYWEIKGGTYDTQAATGQTYEADATPPADLAEVLATPLVQPLPGPVPPWWPDRDDTEESS